MIQVTVNQKRDYDKHATDGPDYWAYYRWFIQHLTDPPIWSSQKHRKDAAYRSSLNQIFISVTITNGGS